MTDISNITCFSLDFFCDHLDVNSEGNVDSKYQINNKFNDYNHCVFSFSLVLADDESSNYSFGYIKRCVVCRRRKCPPDVFQGGVYVGYMYYYICIEVLYGRAHASLNREKMRDIIMWEGNF